MKHIKIFEEWTPREEDKHPPIYMGGEWINNEDGLTYVVVDNFMYKIFCKVKEGKGEILGIKIDEFLKKFTKIEPPAPPAPVKDKYKNYDFELDLNFYKSEYIADEKAIIGAYFITKDEAKYIEVLNIKEYESKTGVYMDNATTYSVSIHKDTLPKSQIEIISPVTGKEGFFYIKIPYWLIKEKPNLVIKRCKLNFNMKRLSIGDAGFGNKELMRMFKDPDVQRYFKVSDTDKATQQMVNSYQKRKI